MNRILTYGLATVLATVFTPTVFADKDGHGGGGGGGRGHGGGGGGGGRSAAPQMSAPANVSAAPRVSMSHSKSNANVMRAPSAPRVATQAQTQFRSAPIARSQATTNFRSPTTRSQRNAPSVAFGGSAIDNNNREGRRSFATTTTPSTTREFSTRDRRDFRVPFETSRNWDRGRVHEWNNHRYRFSGGSWIIIDPGLYDYGYPYDYGVTTYSSPGFVDSSESLVMSAQDRLNRLGYSAGPADGVLGPQTRDAIADFQNDNGLPATGGLNTATVRALGL